MSDVTRILEKIDAGDPSAANDLLPLVYGELRKLAAARLAHEKPGQTLQATALVHEAYLRLVGPAGPAEPDALSGAQDKARPAVGTYNSRAHFFAAAAEAMRRILIDRARQKASVKRGGQLDRLPLNDIAADALDNSDDLLALDGALQKLAEADPQAAQLVKLRYFAGITMDDAAEALGISSRTAYYTWDYARSYLRQALRADSP